MIRAHKHSVHGLHQPNVVSHSAHVDGVVVFSQQCAKVVKEYALKLLCALFNVCSTSSAKTRALAGWIDCSRYCSSESYWIHVSACRLDAATPCLFCVPEPALWYFVVDVCFVCPWQLFDFSFQGVVSCCNSAFASRVRDSCLISRFSMLFSLRSASTISSLGTQPTRLDSRRTEPMVVRSSIILLVRQMIRACHHSLFRCI